jgi:hypothetical protein
MAGAAGAAGARGAAGAPGAGARCIGAAGATGGLIASTMATACQTWPHLLQRTLRPSGGMVAAVS